MVDIDPFKNFTPRGNPLGITAQSAPKEALTEAQIADMLDNPDKLRNLAKSKLIEIIAVSKATSALVPAIKELWDRIDGKPRQQIDTTLKGEMTTTIQIVRFSDVAQDVVIDGDAKEQKLIS